LLRTYLENITKVITGSDGDIYTELDKQLKDAGLVGESILGNKIWIAQTNFPEEIGVAATMVNKCVLLVRNPMDAIYSHFNMAVTNSIEKKLNEEDMERLAQPWDEFLRNEIQVWKKFVDYWMVEPVIPTYVVRYEDLIEDPRSTLKDLFKFLLNVEKVNGTLIDTLIKQETTELKQEYYRQNKPGYCQTRFSEDQKHFMISHAGRTIRRCGYAVGFEFPENDIADTPYFEDDDAFEDSKKYEQDRLVRNNTETNVKVRLDYVDLNEQALSKCAKLEGTPSFESELQLNFSVEDLRTGGGAQLSYKPILEKYEELLPK
jgi:hypothetical protein